MMPLKKRDRPQYSVCCPFLYSNNSTRPSSCRTNSDPSCNDAYPTFAVCSPPKHRVVQHSALPGNSAICCNTTFFPRDDGKQPLDPSCEVSPASEREHIPPIFTAHTAPAPTCARRPASPHPDAHKAVWRSAVSVLIERNALREGL